MDQTIKPPTPDGEGGIKVKYELPLDVTGMTIWAGSVVAYAPANRGGGALKLGLCLGHSGKTVILRIKHGSSCRNVRFNSTERMAIVPLTPKVQDFLDQIPFNIEIIEP